MASQFYDPPREVNTSITRRYTDDSTFYSNVDQAFTIVAQGAPTEPYVPVSPNLALLKQEPAHQSTPHAMAQGVTAEAFVPARHNLALLAQEVLGQLRPRSSPSLSPSSTQEEYGETPSTTTTLRTQTHTPPPSTPQHRHITPTSAQLSPQAALYAVTPEYVTTADPSYLYTSHSASATTTPKPRTPIGKRRWPKPGHCSGCSALAPRRTPRSRLPRRTARVDPEGVVRRLFEGPERAPAHPPCITNRPRLEEEKRMEWEDRNLDLHWRWVIRTHRRDNPQRSPCKDRFERALEELRFVPSFWAPAH